MWDLLLVVLVILFVLGLALGALAIVLLLSVAFSPGPQNLRLENCRRCCRLLAFALLIVLLVGSAAVWRRAQGHFPNGYTLVHERDVDDL